MFLVIKKKTSVYDQKNSGGVTIVLAMQCVEVF